MHGNGGIHNHFVGNIVKVALGRFDHAFDNAFDSRVAQDLIGVGCLIEMSSAESFFNDSRRCDRAREGLE